MPDSSDKLISVLVPVYNEAENIVPCLRGLWAALKEVPHEILICYDFDGDSTLPAIERMSDKPKTLRLVKNDLGRGVAFAMRAGFAAAKGDAVITTMADLSDPPEVILEMAKKIRENGADVVSGSRYMKGGSQTGGPLFKRTLSRLAGLSLHYMAGVNTHDSTTNFRAYSSRFLKKVDVESIYGFELGLELTAKAHTMGFKVDEVPSSWVDRTAGESRFQLWKWMPRYLYWYYSVFQYEFGKLFGALKPEAVRSQGSGDWLRFGVVSAICFLVLAARREDALTRAQFWAEDGPIFFYQQYHDGMRAVFAPYVGYLHVIPRLVALLADQFPIARAPLIYNLCANTITALCCSWICLPAFRHLISSDLRRSLLAVLLAATPMAGVAYTNITNVQWPLLFWCALVVFQPIEKRGARIAMGFVYTLAVLTSVMSIVLFPIWLLRALLTPRDRVYALSMSAVHVIYALLIKFYFESSSPAPDAHEYSIFMMVPAIFSARVLMMGVLGPNYFLNLVPNSYVGVGFAGLICGIVFWWVVWRLRRDRAFCVFMLIWVYLSFSTLTMTCIFRQVQLWSMCFSANGERYVMLGALFMIVVLMAGTERLDRQFRSPLSSHASILLLVLAARAHFFLPAFTDFKWAEYAQILESQRATPEKKHPPVPTNPPGWAIPHH